MSKIRVFLIDDHYVVCEGLRRVLEQEKDLCVVGEADSGEQALRKLQDIKTDVVFLDARLTGMDGIETLQRLKTSHPKLKIIILTSFGDEFLAPSITAGADGFLLKRGNRAEMVKAIRDVVRGGTPLDSMIVPNLLHGLRKHPINSEIPLSSRETEVLELAAAGLNNKDIGDSLEITAQTVKNNITTILRKLGVNGRTHAVTIALRKGWISNPVPVNWKTYA